jgi:hypothetical protein
MAKEQPDDEKNAQQRLAAGDGLLVSLGKIAGVGGIALGTFFLLFRSFLTQRFMSSLSLEPGQGYHLLLLFMLFTFGVATVGLTIWASQRAAGRKISISLLVFALLLAGLGTALVFSDMKVSRANAVTSMDSVPKVRQGQLGTFIARLAPHSNGDRQLQIEGVGLPEDSTVLVQVWKNGREVRQPRGTVERSHSGEWRYEWVTLDEDGEYVLEVQRTGEGANSQLPQQFNVGVGANYTYVETKSQKTEPLSTIVKNKNVFLNVPGVLQEKSEWDGPAIMMALGRYFGKGPTTQADWAQVLNGTTDNVPMYLDRLTGAAAIIGLKGTLIPSPLQDIDIESTINSGGFVVCRIAWQGGGGHFVLISGYSSEGAETYFQVMDPFYGPSLYSDQALRTQYQGAGVWSHSVVLKPD